MTLRSRLFLMFAALAGLLLLAQGWWMRSLHQELSQELGSVAFSVASSTADLFADRGESGPAEGEGAEEGGSSRRGPSEGGPLTRAAKRQERADGEAGGDRGRTEATVSYTLITSSETIAPRGGVSSLEGGEIIRQERRILRHSGPLEEGEIFFVSPDDLRRIPVPRRGFESKLERYSDRLMLGSLGIFGIGLLLAGLLAHRVTRPLGRLAEAADRVGQGSLGAQIAITAGGEVGQTIEAFNAMSRQVHELDTRARELSARQHLGEIGEIARGLAHTLRNPLNALGLSIEELAGRAPEEAAELAASARRQIRRIDESIRSLLALASSGGVREPVDLAALAEDVALEALQDSHGKVSIDVEAAPELPPLEGVEAELRAVLQALLVNAVEASPEGGKIVARLGPGTGGEGVSIEIEDRGPGLAPEIRRRLFTPHLSTKANGSGMGLFLAQRIASGRYGGGLALEDRPGGGTRALLELRDRGEGEAADG